MNVIASMLPKIGGSRMQTSGTTRRRHAVRRNREILGIQGRIRFEANCVATIAQVKSRAASRAYRTTFQTIVVEVDYAKVLAVTAVLPLKRKGRVAGAVFSREVQFTNQMTSILTLDRTLSRCEEAALVLMAENSHFRCSL